jgi:hypothetical protein
MKKILKLSAIVLVAVFVVLGGLVAGIKFGLIPDFPGLFTVADDSAKEAVEQTPLERLGPPPFLLTMKPIEIPVIMNGKLVRRSNFQFRLEVEETDVASLQTAGHQLHARMLEDLMVFLPRHLETRDVVDLVAVKARMRALADRMLGQGRVHDVVIQGYYEH